MACGNITVGSIVDCTNPLQGGVGDNSRLTVINYDDFSSVTLSASTPNLITAITLKSGAVAYTFEGYRSSLKPSYDSVEAKSGQIMYKHRVVFNIFDYSQIQKNNIWRFGNGRYMTIYQNAKKDANAFEFCGIGSGMQMVPGKLRDLQEVNGAHQLTLETNAEELEALPPQTVFITDFATTQALVVALWFLPTIPTFSVLTGSGAANVALTITGTNFFGGTSNDAVVSVVMVNQVTGTRYNIPKGSGAAGTVATTSNVLLTLTTVVVPAGLYKFEVTTLRGVVLQSSQWVAT